MKKQSQFLSIGLIVVLLLSLSPSVQSQQQSMVTDSIETAFLPALSFNSDFGFMAGGLVSRYHYNQTHEPFYSYTQIAAIFSTKGLASAIIEIDKPNVLGSTNRLKSAVYVSRFLNDPYYGIQSYQKIDDSFNSDPDFYSYQSFATGIDAELRIPVSQQFEALAIFNLDYLTPWSNSPNQLIMQERPLGVEGGSNLHLGTGFISDNRNHEFRPSKGTYFYLSVEGGLKNVGSSYSNAIIRFKARNYVNIPLFKGIVFAQQLQLKNTYGDVPFWKLAYAGDEMTLRGYPSGRFRDDHSLILNNELRTWLFDIPFLGAEFGGNLFFDVGKTYANGTPFNALTEDLKYSYGLSGTSSFFTPDFILRTDVGFSEEGVGIYFTAGYMF